MIGFYNLSTLILLYSSIAVSGITPRSHVTIPPSGLPNYTLQRKVSMGISDYRRLLLSGSALIDKTDLVSTIMEQDIQTLLVTRPRRFGKSTSLSMINYFLNRVHYDPTLQNSFKSLNACKNKTFCEKHMHKYAVIHIDFSGSSSHRDVISMFEGIREQIWDGIFTHRTQLLNLIEKNDIQYKEWLGMFSDFKNERGLATVYLPRIILKIVAAYAYVNVSTVVLIDEYDVPFLTAYEKGYFYGDFLDIIRDFYLCSLKSSGSRLGVVTGIATVAKESIFSALNHICVSSVFDPRGYESFFGFSVKEVQQLLEQTNQKLDINELNKWFNGYHIGEATLLNPWSVINSIQTGRIRKYWADTGSVDALLGPLVHGGGSDIQINFEKLMSLKTVKLLIHENLRYNAIGSETEYFWNLLVQTGYLNVKLRQRKKFNTYEDIKYYDVTIPNLEVQLALRTLLRECNVARLSDATKWAVALIEGNISVANSLAKSVFAEPHNYVNFTYINEASPMKKVTQHIQTIVSIRDEEYSIRYKLGHSISIIHLTPIQPDKTSVVILLCRNLTESHTTLDPNEDEPIVDKAIKKVEQGGTLRAVVWNTVKSATPIVVGAIKSNLPKIGAFTWDYLRNHFFH